MLRLEKGHLIIGQDSDGLTTPYEASTGWAVKMDKPFFVGQRSLSILNKKPLTRRLVGFKLPASFTGEAPKECHLIVDGETILGRVTSVGHSPTLGHIIGLAMIRPDLASPGSTFEIRVDGGSLVRAEVTQTPFYDPEGLRQKE
jgi:sarcosine oxidase subunit alpha